MSADLRPPHVRDMERIGMVGDRAVLFHEVRAAEVARGELRCVQAELDERVQAAEARCEAAMKAFFEWEESDGG